MSIIDIYPPMRGLANLPWYALMSDVTVVDESAVSATTLTASASAHTMGAWSELLASASGDGNLLVLQITGVNTNNTDTSMLVDAGTGGAGAEVVRASAAVGGSGTASAVLDAHGNLVFLPLRIATGQRIAARIQAVITSDTATVRWSLLRLGALHMVPESLDALGLNTATSSAVNMSGASGTYVEVVASTARDYRAIVIVPCQGTAGTVMANISVRYTLGIGASNAETDAGSVLWRAATSEAVSALAVAPPLPIARYIPAGSRLSIKHDIASNAGSYGVCLIGVP